MSVSKAARARSTGKSESVGLVANGSSGLWEIAIDQSLSGPDRWFAQIEGPSVYVYFEIASLQIVERATRFLTRGKAGRNAAHNSHNGRLALGSDKSTQVNLLKDDEFCDRYFLVIEPRSGLRIRFTVAGDDLTHLIDALRKAQEDLNEGL